MEHYRDFGEVAGAFGECQRRTLATVSKQHNSKRLALNQNRSGF